MHNFIVPVDDVPLHTARQGSRRHKARLLCGRLPRCCKLRGINYHVIIRIYSFASGPGRQHGTHRAWAWAIRQGESKQVVRCLTAPPTAIVSRISSTNNSIRPCGIIGPATTLRMWCCLINSCCGCWLYFTNSQFKFTPCISSIIILNPGLRIGVPQESSRSRIAYSCVAVKRWHPHSPVALVRFFRCRWYFTNFCICSHSWIVCTSLD